MKKEPEIIKLKITYEDDRTNLILSLAHSGYKVWIQEEQGTMGIEYFVCFEKP